ncbi:MAG: hypothetical protein ABSC37_12930, partial [Xanthobacteraceae bacterium]
FIFFDDPPRFEASADELTQALQTDIGWIRQHTEFGEAAHHWSAAGRPGGLLLRSPDLEDAERWIASRPHGAPAPTEEIQAFIAESRRGATWRRNVLTGSLAAGLLLALALAGLAYWQREIAVEQEAIAQEQRKSAEEQRRIANEQRQQVVIEEMNRRAALSEQLASGGRPQVAVAVALDALRNGGVDKPTPELRAAIHRTLSLVTPPVERYLADNVFNLAVSPDGRTIAAGMAGDAKGVVHILDASTLEPRLEFKTGDDVVSGLDFSPDGKRLAIAGDKIPNVWNVETGAKLFDLQRPDANQFTFRAQFSPDGALIVVTSVENRALIYDAKTGKLLHILPGASYEEMKDRWKAQSPDEFGAADPIVDAVNQANFERWGAATDAAFSPDGKMVAVTGPENPDGSVRLYDAATGKLARTLTGGRGAGMLPPLSYGNRLAFSADGARLIAAPLTTAIKTWDIGSGELLSEIPIQRIGSFVLTADGQAVASVQDNGLLAFSCLAGGVQVATVQAHQGGIDSLSIARDGHLLATGSTDRTARVWRMPTGSEICALARPTQGAGNDINSLSVLRPLAIFAGFGARVTKALFRDDNRALATASQDGWVRSWTVSSGSDSTSIALPVIDNSFGGWERALLSGDGRTIFAYNSGDYRWRAWDIASGQPIEIPGRVKAVAPGDRTHRPILFRSPVSYFPLGSPPSQQNDSQSFGASFWRGPVSTDGSRVVADEEWASDRPAADNPALVLIDSNTKKVLSRLVADGRNAKDFFFSPDGSRLFGWLEKPANDSDNDAGDGLAVWDARSGKLINFIAQITGYSQSVAASVSQNGTRLLLGPSNTGFVIFNVGEDGFKAIDVPDTGTGFASGRSATALRLSDDGTHLAVGRSDGTIVVARIDTGELWRVLDARDLPIKAVAMSQSGNYTAAADGSSTVWIFDSEIGELVDSQAFPAEIVSLFFLPGTDRLAVLDRSDLTIIPALPSFAGHSDTRSMVDSARKLGLHLVSEEDQRRYKLGSLVAPEQLSGHKWAAIDPNNEVTAPVVWAASDAQARDDAIAACQRVSTTCAQKPAVTTDLDSTFVYYCCLRPRLGCAVASGSGDEALRSVKAEVAKANYSVCEVRAAYSARDGS